MNEGGLVIKYIKFIIYASLLFFIGGVVVKANDSYDYTYTGVEMWGSDVENYNTALFNVSDGDGNVFNAYCIDFNTSIVDDYSYSIVNVEDASYIDDDTANIISNIVSNAYPFSNLERIKSISGISNLTEQEAIAAAQGAIWHYANGIDFELEDNIGVLYDYYLTLGKSSTSSTVVSKLDIEFDTYFEEGIRNTFISFDSENVFDLDYSFNKEIESEYGVTIEEINDGILVKNVPNGAEFSVNVKGKQNIVSNVYFFYPMDGEGLSQSLVGVSSGVINVSNSKLINVFDSYYKVTVNKTDSVSLKGISDVKFEISNTSDFSEHVIDGITDENGIIIFDDISNGTWYIREVSTPFGYVINNEVIKIEVKDNDVNVNVVNDPVGKIKIVKENQFGDKLEGVYFNLYKDEVSEDNLIKSNIVTDENGEAIIENLDKGEYILVEIKTREGYILNSENVLVNVDYGKTSNVSVVNKTIDVGSLTIRKLDSSNNMFLEGARIGIYKDEACSELLIEVMTSFDELIVDNIPVGKYCVKEISAPSGYILNLDKFFVDVGSNQIVNLDIYNHKIYDTSLNHYTVFVVGIVSSILFLLLYMGYNLWLKKV